MSGEGTYRYPGPPEFEDTPEDRRRFFGRDDEIAAATQRIIASHLLVIYGNSGLGKSSLLKAGVFPKLRREGLLPIRVRLNKSTELRQLITEACQEVKQDLGGEFELDYTAGEGTTLWEFFKTAMFWHDDTLLPPVLVFDQFEEIFTLADASWRREFACQIGPLFSGNVPDTVRQRMKSGSCRLNDLGPIVKIVFCLREEYYGSLQDLSADFPGLFQDRFRLRPLHEPQARLAIEQPAVLSSPDFKTPAFEYDEATLSSMLHFLKGRFQAIEPFQLQLLCQYVEQTIVEGKVKSGAPRPIRVTPRDLGGEEAMKLVLRQFYADSVNHLPAGERKRARQLCEEGLLSETGNRLMLEKDQIRKDYKLGGDTLRYLADNRRILRQEPKLESTFFEISHDTIARSIFENKRWRLPRKWRLPVAVGAPLLALFTIAVIWFIFDLSKARRAAEFQAKNAWEQKAAALAARKEAENQAQNALAQKASAVVARKEAENQAQNALVQKASAVAARKEAENQALNALVQKASAVAAQEESKTERRRADQQAEFFQAGELIRAANSTLDTDPQLSALLALRADWVFRQHSNDIPSKLLSNLLDALNRAVQTSLTRGTVELSHEEVFDITFSQDGKLLATSGPQGVVKVWDSLSGKPLQTLREDGDSDNVTSVSFSLDAKWLATVDGEGHVKVWEISSHRNLWNAPAPLNEASKVTHVAFSPRGEQLATGDMKGDITLWDGTSGKSQHLGQHDRGVSAMAFSRDGKQLATGSEDNTAKVWDARSGSLVQTLSGHTAPILALDFSEDGKYLATGGSDATVRLWNLTSGKLLRTLWRGGNYVFSVAFDPTGNRILSGSLDGTATLWDTNSGRELLSLAGQKGPIQSIAFAPDGIHVMTASWDRTVRVWDVPFIHSAAAGDVKFSPKGDMLASAGFDSTIKVWNANGDNLKTIHDPNGKNIAPFFSIAFKPDGRILATSGFDNRVRIWDCSSGKQLYDWDAGAESGISFSPDGTRLATGGRNNTAKIWDASTGKQLLTLVGHHSTVNDVTFSPNGQLLATAGFDDLSARIWDASSGQQLFELSGDKGHNAPVVWVAFSPDGKRLATASEDRTAKVWDFTSGKTLTLTGHTNVIEEVAFSHDGRRVATASVDGTARIWDAQSGKELYRFTHPHGVEALSFSPDGKRLATAADDGRVRVFILDREELVGLASSRIRAWTDDECEEYLGKSHCPPELTSLP